MKFSFGLNADAAGFFTSLLCAVHCSAVPILISFGLLSAGTWLHNHMIDWVVIGLGFVFASYSLVGDFKRRHRNPLPLIMALAGFGMLLLGMVEHHGWMLVFSVLGGLSVASSHLLNFRLTRMITVKA
jgi:hypothetical protein